jgi:hypothetical protein
MASAVIDLIAEGSRVVYSWLAIGVRRLSRHRRRATKSIAFSFLAIWLLWVARETYYLRTEPRIDPGANVVAVAPLVKSPVYGYDFSLLLLAYEPQVVTTPNGWWARLKPGFDLNSGTEANSVSFRLMGPGPSCRVYRLHVGGAAVYAPGDATILFTGMYSGRARFKVEPYSRVSESELTIELGRAADVPGTDLMIAVSPNPESLNDIRDGGAGTRPSYPVYTVSCLRCPENDSVTGPARLGNLTRLQETDVQVSGVLPNQVTFRIHHHGPVKDLNPGCGCDGDCAIRP